MSDPLRNPSAPPARRPAHARLLLRIALACASLFVALLAGEALARVRASAAGRPHVREAALHGLWEIATGMSADLGDGQVVLRSGLGESRVMLHPYLGFDAANGLEQYAAAATEFRRAEARETFDVVVLGGSVASLVAMEAEPALVEVLRQDPRLAGRAVRVHVFSRGAFKQPQQLIMLAYLLNLGVEPDAVLNIDGYNEFSVNPVRVEPEVHPVQPLLSYWGSVIAGAASLDTQTVALREEAMALTLESRRFTRRFAALGLERSALATWGADAWLRRNRARMVAAQEAYVRRLTERDADPEAGPSRAMLGPRLPEGASSLESAARIWCESSRMLRAICGARGIPYVHVLQPTLHDEGSKPLTDEERRTGTLDEGARRAVHHGYPLLRGLGQELAAEGECFVDASRLFADAQETLYYDACHFRAPGTDMLAREAARALLRALP